MGGRVYCVTMNLRRALLVVLVRARYVGISTSDDGSKKHSMKPRAMPETKSKPIDQTLEPLSVCVSVFLLPFCSL